ncbi:MAG: protein-L-isoaspartate(D-aspartate) O-methyltransferase [Crocosphaera sp.]|nr:protein-L-isoaspartate(D-aspartate) O-methyltransferase [Crocosphaera sp.]
MFSAKSQEHSTVENESDQGFWDNLWYNQRQNMVEQDIRRRGIKNPPLLAALAKIPRHRFVLPEWAELAYQDRPLPIGHNQTISQPYIVAAMTQAAEISPQDKVLEIGTGSGYQTAILGELAKEVYTIEIIPSLAQKARNLLKELGYTNIHSKIDNGYQGWLEYAPYDVILVTAAPPTVPSNLKEQLAINGRMVIPVGIGTQELLKLRKTPTKWMIESIFPVRFVPLIH